MAGIRRRPRLAAAIGGGVVAIAAGVTALALVSMGSPAPVKPAVPAAQRARVVVPPARPAVHAGPLVSPSRA
jgi:hypothetical protein